MIGVTHQVERRREESWQQLQGRQLRGGLLSEETYFDLKI
jgi:hypothetical protein